MNKTSQINQIIIRQLQMNALEYDCFFDFETNGEMVACRDFVSDIFDERSIFSKCSDAELVCCSMLLLTICRCIGIFYVKYVKCC